MVELGLKSVEEVLLSGVLQPLRRTDLRARLHELVTASDASETGGGMVYGHKLSQQGLKEVLAIEEGLDAPPVEEVNVDGPQVVLAIDFFAGIGGLSRALQLADVKVAHLLVVENDPDCRRLNAVRWPGCELMSDIKKITKKELEKVIRGVPDLTGVIAGGGSPCQGLSQLSANRRHLEDPRSKLFYRLCEVFGWIADICGEMEVWNVNFLENVVGDDADVEEMSEELGAPPLRVCSRAMPTWRTMGVSPERTMLSGTSSVSRSSWNLWSSCVMRDGCGQLEIRMRRRGCLLSQGPFLEPGPLCARRALSIATRPPWGGGRRTRWGTLRTPTRKNSCSSQRRTQARRGSPQQVKEKGWWDTRQGTRWGCSKRSQGPILRWRSKK